MTAESLSDERPARRSGPVGTRDPRHCRSARRARAESNRFRRGLGFRALPRDHQGRRLPEPAPVYLQVQGKDRRSAPGKGPNPASLRLRARCGPAVRVQGRAAAQPPQGAGGLPSPFHSDHSARGAVPAHQPAGCEERAIRVGGRRRIWAPAPRGGGASHGRPVRSQRRRLCIAPHSRFQTASAHA